MKNIINIIKKVFIAVFLIFLVITGGFMLFNRSLKVGKDIKPEDITEFYFTLSTSTNPPEFFRYLVSARDGKHYLYYEERQGDHWPLTEDDISISEEIELTQKQWEQIYSLLDGGKVRKRKESVTSGSSGPDLYLYSTKDKGVYQEFEFASFVNLRGFDMVCTECLESAHEDK